MKTSSLKAFLILVGLMLFNTGHVHAGIIDKFKDFTGTEFNNFQGLYIMAGVIVASLILYIMVNHFGKEEEQRTGRYISHTGHYRRHQHHHKIIKKTQ